MSSAYPMWHTHPTNLHPVKGLVEHPVFMEVAVRNCTAKLLRTDQFLLPNALEDTVAYRHAVDEAKRYLVSSEGSFGGHSVLVAADEDSEKPGRYPGKFWRDSSDNWGTEYRLLEVPCRILRGRVIVAALREIGQDPSARRLLFNRTKTFAVGLVVYRAEQERPLSESTVNALISAAGKDLRFSAPKPPPLDDNDADDATERRDSKGARSSTACHQH